MVGAGKTRLYGRRALGVLRIPSRARCLPQQTYSETSVGSHCGQMFSPDGWQLGAPARQPSPRPRLPATAVTEARKGRAWHQQLRTDTTGGPALSFQGARARAHGIWARATTVSPALWCSLSLARASRHFATSPLPSAPASCAVCGLVADVGRMGDEHGVLALVVVRRRLGERALLN